MVVLSSKLIILSSCGPKPISKPKLKHLAESDRAFSEINNEVKTTDIEADLEGIAQQVNGKINSPEALPDPNIKEMHDYEIGKPGWITLPATRIFPENVSNYDARQQLLTILRNEVISKKVTRSVEITSVLTDVISETKGNTSEQTVWSGFFKSTISGVITKEIIISETDPIYLKGKNSFEKTLTLKAYVEPVQGQRDIGFQFDSELKNNMLTQGESLEFNIKPTKDCYVYAFNLMADHNAVLMFPNEYMADNFVKRGTKITIPDPKVQNYIKFVVDPMNEEEITIESIYIVCTKERVAGFDELPQIGRTIQAFPAEGKTFIKLQRWLTTIPLNQRVEKNLIYYVSKLDE